MSNNHKKNLDDEEDSPNQYLIIGVILWTIILMIASYFVFEFFPHLVSIIFGLCATWSGIELKKYIKLLFNIK